LVSWFTEFGIQGIPSFAGFDPFRHQRSILLSIGWRWRISRTQAIAKFGKIVYGKKSNVQGHINHF
jgi:hypothetical protein